MGADVPNSVRTFVRGVCADCHDGSDDDRWNLLGLSNDLNDADVFRKWERVFDRVHQGEMPPADSQQPKKKDVQRALDNLSDVLDATNRKQQRQNGRVILRRLNRTEYNYTLQDLLGISADLTEYIPEENASSGFDTVFNNQGLSPLHIKSLLTAADVAIQSAIELGRTPKSRTQRFLYREQAGVRKNIDKDEKAIVGELDDAVVMYANASYIFKVQGLHIEHAGRYRIRAAAWAHQADNPVVLTLNAGNYKRGQTRLLGFFDLQKPQRVVEVEAVLNNNEYLFPGVTDLNLQKDGKSVWNTGAEKYSGEGVALKWIEVEGPLTDSWPPQYTRDFLAGIEIRKRPQIRWINGRHEEFEIVPGDDPLSEIGRVLQRFAPRALRRPLQPGETDEWLQLAADALEQKRPFAEAIRIACRAVLNSPEFLFHVAEPGRLDDFALAARLSYFLWKSLPDDELRALAAAGTLRESKVLREQVERMLSDEKSARFVKDFTDQWLRLSEIDATTPDKRLYPEYNELLKQSMLRETRSFFTHLMEKDLSTRNFIDSDFALLNRRMADHYGIPGVIGQQFRRVSLPANSQRGGMMTHASVLKVTANGTVTSPVSRGSWVLTHLLGQPPSPPPPDIGSIEPDTRGTTTIRETLARHRDNETCAACHQSIDPPGFALESFDVIGGYRTRYRSVGKDGDRPEKTLNGRNIWEYRLVQPVDSSGQTADGQRFANIQEFRSLLLRDHEQVARNFIENLIVYSTGAEIQFADRRVVEDIMRTVRTDDFGVRSVIHAVVQSSVFREK